jgi:hypothetical protein
VREGAVNPKPKSQCAHLIIAVERRAAHEPIHDVDPQTGASIVVFYVASGLAKSVGLRGAGWFCSFCRRGYMRGDSPVGPFTTAYTAYREALARSSTPP